MFIALDENNNRISAEVADKERNYYCPVCHGEVRLRADRDGSLVATHFAHKTLIECDDFTSDMSEWHRQWQAMFPERNREYVITDENTGEKHRADVLCYGTVIEFQHSPISIEEFYRRNSFYTSSGYKVVWIFDARDVYEDERIECYDDWHGNSSNGGKYKWKYAWRMLSDFYPQNERDISVFFQFVDFDKDGDETCYMERVVWAIEERGMNSKGLNPWSRFRTSYDITDKKQLLEWLKDRWTKEKNPIKETPFSEKNYKYKMGDRIIEAEEFEKYLRQHAPYHVVQSGMKNNPKYATGFRCASNKEFVCPDSHQKPCIQVGHCRYGCYSCIAVEQISNDNYNIYCKYYYKEREEMYDPIFVTRIYT